MKGATIEPLARTSKPPMIIITITIGASQSFLRTRKNTKSSLNNPINSNYLKTGS